MIKQQMILSIIGMAAILTSGCGMAEGKADAEKVGAAFIDERIEKGGFGNDGFYSNIFWKNTSREKWHNLNQLIDKALGKLKSCEPAGWHVNANAAVGSDLNGTVVTLTYKCTYEKGDSTDTVTLHQPTNKKGFKIVGVNFTSPLIQQAIDESIAQSVAAPSAEKTNDTNATDTEKDSQ